MARLTLAGFKDPARRPRYIIWSGVALLGLAAFVVVAFMGTSTYWFCAEVCHKVQDDSIMAYDRSSHNKVSCMSCHEPVNADPITFTFYKAKALGELVLTVTNNYELPLNAESHLAEDEHHMGSAQCTQCHALDTRVVTPSEGIIIDHAVHEENDIHCTMCHNRVAHPEDFELTLTDPKTGEPNRKHEDFMEMKGCYRAEGCHGLEAGYRAPGECSACHPADFELKPENHLVAGFYTPGGDSSGHWQLKEEEPDYCRICHLEQTFCTDCHGVEMPHPAGFTDDHGAVGTERPEVCANCHARGAERTDPTSTEFCNACHHPDADPTQPWIPQHWQVVRESGAEACFECHDPVFCARCHVNAARP
ncbi:MAG: cytochrome c3 family protein [Anaerosomatales bacterium]|nr:cytochrome c3 family protein [Anaerosomatales bacterium]